MLQILSWFREDGWEILYSATSQHSPHTPDLSEWGMKTHPVVLNDDAFNVFVKDYQPQVVIFDRFMTEEQFGWRVAQECPQAIRIIETVDLHFLRKARKLSANPGKADFRNRDTAREIAAMYRSDLNFIISSAEMELLQQYFGFPQSLMLEVPFMVNQVSVDHHNQFPTFSNRKNFVTIGNFLHEPNLKSVQLLKDTIWPIIRQSLPEAHLYVYGAYMPENIKSWHQPSAGFYMMGRAEESLQVIAASRVFLAPLTFGAGQKGKLLDAMLSGTPSVTTTVGAESMHPGLEWNGNITDDLSAFAEAAVKLYTNEEIWSKAAAQSTRILQQVFDRNIHGPAMMAKIYQMLDNRESCRIENFNGYMLMQEFNYATKYMSRWISLKNQSDGLE